MLLALLMTAGCATTPDEDMNTQVFRTPEELLAARTARQRETWKELAATLLQEERPGVSVATSGELSVIVSADGAQATFDLAPIEDLLTAQSDRADIIIRDHFRKSLDRFDQARLARWPYARAQPLLRPMFISASQVAGLNQDGGSADPTSTPAIHNYPGGIRWIVAIQWQPGILSPIGPSALSAWNKPVEELRSTALTNVAAEVANHEFFDTTPFGAIGRVGALRPGINPAVVLSPEFLAAVRKQWQISGDLALLIATPNYVQFVEAENTKLLDSIYPGFASTLQSGANPLSQAPVRLGNDGVVPLQYQPPALLTPSKTQPSRSPLTRPTSRPTGTYIVN